MMRTETIKTLTHWNKVNVIQMLPSGRAGSEVNAPDLLPRGSQLEFDLGRRSYLPNLYDRHHFILNIGQPCFTYNYGKSNHIWTYKLTSLIYNYI